MTIEQERKAVRYSLLYLKTELIKLKNFVENVNKDGKRDEQMIHVKRRIEEMERDVIEFEQLNEQYL